MRISSPAVFGALLVFVFGLCIASYRIGVSHGVGRLSDSSPSIVPLVEGEELSSEGQVTEDSSLESSVLALTNDPKKIPKKELMTYFQNQISEMQADEALSIRDEISALEPDQAREFLLRQFYKKWGELDGETAFVSVLDGGSENGLRNVGEVAAGWATNDPTSAWEALMLASNNGAMYGVSLFQTLKAVADKDKALALQMLEDIQGFRKANEISNLMNSVDNVESLSEYMTGILGAEDLNSRGEFSKQLFRKWASLDFDDALNTISSLEEAEVARMSMHGLLSDWAGRDGEEALAYVLANSDNPSVEGALVPVIETWSQSISAIESGEIFSAIKNIPNKDAYMREFVPRLISVDPKATMELVSRVSDDQLRRNVESMAVSLWSFNDLDSAESHVFEGVKNESMQASSLNSMLFRRLQVGGDFSPYLEELENAKSSKERLMLISGIVHMGDTNQIVISKSGKDMIQTVIELYPDEVERTRQMSRGVAEEKVVEIVTD